MTEHNTPTDSINTPLVDPTEGKRTSSVTIDGYTATIYTTDRCFCFLIRDPAGNVVNLAPNGLKEFPTRTTALLAATVVIEESAPKVWALIDDELFIIGPGIVPAERHTGLGRCAFGIDPIPWTVVQVGASGNTPTLIFSDASEGLDWYSEAVFEGFTNDEARAFLKRSAQSAEALFFQGSTWASYVKDTVDISTLYPSAREEDREDIRISERLRVLLGFDPAVVALHKGDDIRPGLRRESDLLATTARRRRKLLLLSRALQVADTNYRITSRLQRETSW